MQDIDPRILIVDDQPESIALLLRYFEGQPVDVMIAVSGVDGLRRVADAPPDIVLLDVAMPGMDGFEVCRRLKADPDSSDIPVIFLSANSGLEHRLDGFACGAVDYIGKPFSAEEVLARAFVHVRHKRKMQTLEAISFQGAPAGRSDSASRDKRLVMAAIAELRRDDAAWNGLDMLARRVGTHGKKLTELFRTQFGMTVYEYLIDIRLETARWHLSNTTTQIQSIAERAGYRNPSDFSRAFRHRYGVGPRQYRKAGAPATPGRPVQGVRCD